MMTNNSHQIYYMTIKVPDEYHPWERCRAKTELGAKREASKRYWGNRLDRSIAIGVLINGWHVEEVAWNQWGRWH